MPSQAVESFGNPDMILEDSGDKMSHSQWVQLGLTCLLSVNVVLFLLVLWRQHAMMDANLRLSLYQKRLNVYQRIHLLIWRIQQELILSADEMAQLRMDVEEASFLFSSSDLDFLHQLDEKISACYRLSVEINSSPMRESEFAQRISMRNDLSHWLVQHRPELQTRMEKYLKLTDL